MPTYQIDTPHGVVQIDSETEIPKDQLTSSVKSWVDTKTKEKQPLVVSNPTDSQEPSESVTSSTGAELPYPKNLGFREEEVDWKQRQYDDAVARGDIDPEHPYTQAAEVMGGQRNPLADPDKPLVNLPVASDEQRKNSPITAGALSGASKFISALTSPANITTLAGLAASPSIIQKLAGMGFTVEGAKGVYEESKQLAGETDPSKKSELMTGILLNSVMTVLGAHGVLNETAKPAITKQEASQVIKNIPTDQLESVANDPKFRETYPHNDILDSELSNRKAQETDQVAQGLEQVGLPAAAQAAKESGVTTAETALKQVTPDKEILTQEEKVPIPGKTAIDDSGTMRVSEGQSIATPPEGKEAPSPTSDTPHIISTAIKEGDNIYTGSEWNQKHDLIAATDHPNIFGVENAPKEESRGFIAQDANGKEKFVSRKEAAVIARDAGQLKEESQKTDSLQSEDLQQPEKISKVGRVLSEAFGDADQSLGISGVKHNEAVKKYADSWIERGKELKQTAKGVLTFAKNRDARDLIAAKFDAAENQAGLLAKQMANHVELEGRETKSQLVDIEQKAATFVRQSNGDKDGMLSRLKILAENKPKYSSIYNYAKDHWDSLQKVADAAKEGTDAAHKQLEDSGVNVDYRENYVKGAYFDPHSGKVVIDAQKGGTGPSTSFKKAKVFNDYIEAIEAGYEPKELRLNKLTESATLSQLRAANRAKWASALGEAKMPDGKPVMGEPVVKESVDSTGKKKTSVQAPEGYKMVQVGGQMVPIHEEMAPLIKRLTEASHFPEILSKAGAFVKHNILVFDIFHGSRFAQMQMAFQGMLKPSYHKGLALLEYADKDLNSAVKSGKITADEANWAKEYRPKLNSMIEHGLNVGRISDALFAEHVPIIPGAKSVNNLIFQKLSRGIITQSAAYAFDRNAKLHPEWSQEKLARYTAKEVNTYYRNLGNQGIFKSKTFQDLSRVLFFAPQWIEGMVRSEARGYGQLGKAAIPGKNFGKVGNIVKGMGTGLVAYFTVAQLVNYLTRGKPTWENDEPGHEFDAWIPDNVQGSKGYFINPLSVFAENTHDIIKYAERGMEPLDVAAQMGANKLHPLVHAFRDVIFGRDFFGKPLHGWDRLKQGISDIVPIPLAAKATGYKGGVERQLLSTAGIKVTPAPSSTSSAYELANTFLRENNIEKPPFGTSPYSDMRAALRDGDLNKAREAYLELLKKKSSLDITQAMRRYEDAPFTGIKKQEGKFRKTLDRGQLDLYNDALKEKEGIVRNFYKMKQIK